VTGLGQVPSQVLARLAATDNNDLVMLYIRHYSPPLAGKPAVSLAAISVTGGNNITSVCHPEPKSLR
jgi:hypothetical protein